MKNIKIILVFIFMLFMSGLFYAAAVDLRNILAIEGFQENPLLGYGVVVGLKGTGDSDSGTQTKEIISRIANNFGFKINAEKIKPKNSAVVLVSALITPFSQPGSKIDVKVSSIYDAKSLEGGELIITPLIAGDNEIYAIAQGSIMTERTLRGVIGTISQGAIIQKQIENNIVDSNNTITFIVMESLGYNAINKTVDAIRQKYPDAVQEVSYNRIKVKIPAEEEIYKFIDNIYKINVDVEEEPSVLVDAKSGILISGGNVYLSEAAISYNGIKLEIGGNKSKTGDTQSEGNVKLLKATSTVQDLVNSLNQTGFSGSDIVKILQLLYKNGNLKARLIIQ